MAIMPQEVQELFARVPAVAFATASADNQPNACVVGMKFIIDDETVYLSDQFFNKTLANALATKKGAVVFWEGHDAYQIHGTLEYVNEGEFFEGQAARVNGLFANMGMPIKTKGGIILHVEAVYNTAAGPEAGKLLA